MDYYNSRKFHNYYNDYSDDYLNYRDLKGKDLVFYIIKKIFKYIFNFIILLLNNLHIVMIFAVVIAIVMLASYVMDKTASIFQKSYRHTVEVLEEKNSDEYYMGLVSQYVAKLDTQLVSDIINSYDDLAIVKCDGFINFRSEPDEKNTRSIIGLLNNNAAVNVLQYDIKDNSIYSKVESGGMTGYVAKKFLVLGDEAKRLAKKDIKLRATVLVDKLRMRSEPNLSAESVIGTTYKGERYEVVDRDTPGWIKVLSDNIDNKEYAYINADSKYLSVSMCLNEARTQDLKNDVINYYDNIGVSIAKDYVNIRKTAKANGTIVGKLPGKAGCEILGESGSFYRIKSGIVTGYVSKQYIATNDKAEQLAVQYADLRAIIKIAAMKVRTGPGKNYKQWTRVTKEETYVVKSQLDGWVQIEIDDDDGYISTENNYVEVRYALEQAIPYTPVSTSKTSSVRNNIKEYAVKYIGGKYVWGGNSLTSGTDCSGFVQLIYKHFGVSLPRVAKEQAKKGVEVSSSNKKVGDLIFYANSKGVIDHVAIYIGNNQVVHAASTRSGIRISTWNYREPAHIRNVLGNK